MNCDSLQHYHFVSNSLHNKTQQTLNFHVNKVEKNLDAKQMKNIKTTDGICIHELVIMQPTESVLQQVARRLLVGALLCGRSAGYMHRHAHSCCNHTTPSRPCSTTSAHPDVFFPFYRLCLRQFVCTSAYAAVMLVRFSDSQRLIIT